jgi:CDP-paratose 2-epimerase
VATAFADWRAGDQRYYVSDPSLARRELRLKPPRDWRSGVKALADWLAAERAGTAGTARELEAACPPR